MADRNLSPGEVVETSKRIAASRIGDGRTVAFTHDHCVDSMASTEKGLYEYYYEYELYRFSDGARSLVARSYTDESDEAHFLRIETSGGVESLTEESFELALVQTALRHLRSIGKRKLHWLNVESKGDAYVGVPGTAGGSR